MKYLKTFESDEDTNYGYKSMNSYGDIIIDLIKFNNYYRLLYDQDKINMLKKMLVGKIVGFRGRHGMNFFNDKKVIKDIDLVGGYAGHPSFTYQFQSDDNKKYTIDNDYPITIYITETEANKYNL